MKAWFVVRTKTCSEEQSAAHLKRQEFEVFLPRYRKQIRHARKVSTVLRPLFAGYLFVRIDTDEQRWRSINSTLGVISLVPSGSVAYPICDEIIDDLRAREDKDGVLCLGPIGLKSGDLVRFRDGVFVEHIAFLEEVCDEKRVILLLDLMGSQVRVTTRVENLAKVS